MRRNFYVDDLLKSANTVQEAVTLIRNVAGMCAAAGFNLTKFTSNTKEVMMAIPEAKHPKGLKNQNLVSGTIPQESVLGINWNVEEDKLGFQVQLPEKSLTRRGLLSMLSSVYDSLGLYGPFILERRSIIQKLCKTTLAGIRGFLKTLKDNG